MAESEGLEPPRAINPSGFQDRPTTIITTLHESNLFVILYIKKSVCQVKFGGTGNRTQRRFHATA